MAEVIHFERKKMTLVKIPIIVHYVELETKVSGAHKLNTSTLKKGKVVLREPSMFLFCAIVSLWKVTLLVFLHSFILISG